MPDGAWSGKFSARFARYLPAVPRAVVARRLARCAAAVIAAVEAVSAPIRAICSRVRDEITLGTRLPAAALVDALEPRQLLSATYFVATNGSDSNPGTLAAPFQTIGRAANIAGPGDTVDIMGGTYRETVRPASSGAAGAPITYQAYDGEQVVIDGANPITNWSNYSGSIYEANDPTDLGFGNNQVFVNGTALTEASWPNIGLDLSYPRLAVAQAGGSSLTDNALLTSGVNWTGGVIHIISGEAWVSQTATITGDYGNRITFNLGATVDPHGGIQAGNEYYLTGKLGALDSPGQFFLGTGSSLYLWAPDGSNPNADDVEVKERAYGFNLSGRSNINIQGINLFACSIYANDSSNVHIQGITAEYVSQFTMLSNGWDPPNTGIVFNGYDNSITNSVIAYSAGDGVTALGSGNVVSNNVIHDCDYSASDAAGIYVWGSGNTISHNTIYNCGRDGIKFSNSTDTSVTYNLVHDVMLQTTDGGGIYTYGTNGAGSQVAYNECYNIHSGGWGAAGLYLDNDSSNFSVHNNDVFDVDIALKMNPTSYGEKIVDNTLLGDMDSVGSSGSRNMSGSQFIGNVFNSKLMIGGSVAMADNVSGGDTAGVFSAGATIGGGIPPVEENAKSVSKVSASEPAAAKPASDAPAGSAPAGSAPAPAVPAVAGTPASFPWAAVGPNLLPTPLPAVATTPQTTLTPAQQVQADITQLAADRQSLAATIASDKAAAGTFRAGDLASISAVSARIKANRHDRPLLATDRAAIAADRRQLHTDMTAAWAKLAGDKAVFAARIKADKLQLKIGKRQMAQGKKHK